MARVISKVTTLTEKRPRENQVFFSKTLHKGFFLIFLRKYISTYESGQDTSVVLTFDSIPSSQVSHDIVDVNDNRSHAEQRNETTFNDGGSIRNLRSTYFNTRK